MLEAMSTNMSAYGWLTSYTFKKIHLIKYTHFPKISFHWVCCFPETERRERGPELCPNKKEVIDFPRVSCIREYKGTWRGK